MSKQKLHIFIEINLFNYRDVIWTVRIQEIQLNIIDHLSQLTIWNAGKQVEIILQNHSQ
jgi:cytochrome b subunit of formate dehydrogenase